MGIPKVSGEQLINFFWDNGGISDETIASAKKTFGLEKNTIKTYISVYGIRKALADKALEQANKVDEVIAAATETNNEEVTVIEESKGENIQAIEDLPIIFHSSIPLEARLQISAQLPEEQFPTEVIPVKKKKLRVNRLAGELFTYVLVPNRVIMYVVDKAATQFDQEQKRSISVTHEELDIMIEELIELRENYIKKTE